MEVEKLNKVQDRQLLNGRSHSLQILLQVVPSLVQKFRVLDDFLARQQILRYRDVLLELFMQLHEAFEALTNLCEIKIIISTFRYFTMKLTVHSLLW